MGAAGHVPVAVCEIKTGILTALVFVDQKTADDCCRLEPQSQNRACILDENTAWVNQKIETGH